MPPKAGSTVKKKVTSKDQPLDVEPCKVVSLVMLKGRQRQPLCSFFTDDADAPAKIEAAKQQAFREHGFDISFEEEERQDCVRKKAS